jgi:transposase
MNLPPPGITRWTAWQKVAVLRAVRNGVLTPDEIRARYLVSEEELAGWQADFDRNGLAGLQQKSLRQRRRQLGRG